MTRYFRLSMLFGVCGLAMCAGMATAQNRTTAQLAGTVTDPSGGVIPGVTVIVTSVQTGVTLRATTNKVGYYVVPFLPPATYSIKYERPGFKTVDRNNVELQLDQNARVDVTLPVGAAESTVTVQGTPLLDQTDSQRGTNVSNVMVEKLPLVGRDPSSLATLAAGTSTAQSGVGANPDPGRRSINGNRAFSMSATVNGGSMVLPQSENFSAFVPPLADVAEFAVVQDNFGAEYENGTSVLNMITKSGTNQFHGSLFEYLENDILDASNRFALTKPPLRYNQFGGTVGGPIKRNKLFFFFSYQNTLNPNSTINVHTTPTAAVKGGDFTGYPVITDPLTGLPFPSNKIPPKRIDPVANAIQSYFPAPNLPGLSNNFNNSTPQVPRSPYYDGRIDDDLSQANQLSLSLQVDFTSTQGTSSWGKGPVCYGTENCGDHIINSQQWGISDRWTLGPSAINEFRVNYVRQHYNTIAPSANQDFPAKLKLNNVPPYYFPTISISGAILTSLAPGKIGGGTQNTFSYGDDFTWVKGRHTLKMGGELDKFQYNTLVAWSSGSFGFTGLFTGQGYADFLLGMPSSYALTVTPYSFGARRTSVAGFVQDNFHVVRNLNLNFGLRYNFEGGFSEAHNRLANFSPTTINPATSTPGAIVFANSNDNLLQENHTTLFSPRVGFAWTAPHNWVMRGGYGVFVVPISAQRNFNDDPPGYSINESLKTTDLHTPVFQLSQGPPPYQLPDPSQNTGAVLNGQTTSYWPYEAPQAYVQQWQLSVEKQLGVSTTVEASYVGNLGDHLLFPRDLNQVPQNLLGPGNAQLNRPFPQYQGITTLYNDASSNYHAGQVEIQRRFAHGFTFLSNYTFSKSMDDSSYDLTTGSGGEYQIASDPSLSYALSQFDQTQRFVFASVYDIPAGRSQKFLNRGGFLNAVLGGWETSVNFAANTGSPFTVYEGGANTSNSLAGSLYPNRVKSGVLPSGQRTIAHWFDTTAFVNPPLYHFGTSGRNILRGPDFWNLDSGLMKNFALPLSLREQPHLQVRGDFFNVLNHPNLAQPNGTTGSSAFGTITSASPGRTIEAGFQLSF
jgi:Carboxypeptidase regulatory-like domain